MITACRGSSYNPSCLLRISFMIRSGGNRGHVRARGAPVFLQGSGTRVMRNERSVPAVVDLMCPFCGRAGEDDS